LKQQLLLLCYHTNISTAFHTTGVEDKFVASFQDLLARTSAGESDVVHADRLLLLMKERLNGPGCERLDTGTRARAATSSKQGLKAGVKNPMVVIFVMLWLWIVVSVCLNSTIDEEMSGAYNLSRIAQFQDRLSSSSSSTSLARTRSNVHTSASQAIRSSSPHITYSVGTFETKDAKSDRKSINKHLHQG
jgi:hypothetical protein